MEDQREPKWAGTLRQGISAGKPRVGERAELRVGRVAPVHNGQLRPVSQVLGEVGGVVDVEGKRAGERNGLVPRGNGIPGDRSSGSESPKSLSE